MRHLLACLAVVLFAGTINAQTYYGYSTQHLENSKAAAESYLSTLDSTIRDAASIEPLYVYINRPYSPAWLVAWSVQFSVDDLFADCQDSGGTYDFPVRTTFLNGCTDGLGGWNVTSFSTELARNIFETALTAAQRDTLHKWKVVGTNQYAANRYVIAYQGFAGSCP